LGYYDKVLSYGEVESLSSDAPTVLVDMAGDGKLLHGVHNHFQDNLKHSCIVGATHWEEREPQHELPGPIPQFFFAPTQLKKRSEDWGAAGLEQRYGDAWRSFLPSAHGCVQLHH